MTIFPPGYVTIGEVARVLVAPGVDANPLEWQVDDVDRSDLRRNIAISLGVVGTEGLEERPAPGVLQHVRLMWEHGKLTPRSPGHAFPPTSSDQIGTDWLLSPDDATRLVNALGAPPAKSDAAAITKSAPRLSDQSIRPARQIKGSPGKDAADARWAHLPEFKAKALEVANSKGFTSYAAAAREAALQLDPKPKPKSRPSGADEYYPPTTIEGWLKEAGWMPAAPHD